MEQESFKAPLYWYDVFIQLNSDKKIGRVCKYIFAYVRHGTEPDKRTTPRDEYIVWSLFKRDIDYQRDHSRSYKYVDKATETRRSTEYKEWRKAVYERDDYTCQACGEKGGKLNAHHIKQFAYFPNERLNVDNGITLCEKCHHAVHRGELAIVQE